MLLAGRGRFRRAGEEALQGARLDSSFAKLACGAGGRGEALDPVAFCLSGAADDSERGGLARTGEALNPLNPIP